MTRRRLPNTNDKKMAFYCLAEKRTAFTRFQRQTPYVLVFTVGFVVPTLTEARHWTWTQTMNSQHMLQRWKLCASFVVCSEQYLQNTMNEILKSVRRKAPQNHPHKSWIAVVPRWHWQRTPRGFTDSGALFKFQHEWTPSHLESECEKRAYDSQKW